MIMPFGPYEDFQDCVNQNQDKADPEAFCADLHFKITGEWPSENQMPTATMERRAFFADECRAAVGEDGKLIGYAAVFDRLSADLGGFREYVRRGAFEDSLRRDDVAGLFNHDVNFPLARLVSGTMRLREDDIGLRYEMDLPETSYARDIAEVVKRGDVRGSSFSFFTEQDRWFEEDGEKRRELLRVKVMDVGPVTFPAYPATTVSARALLASRGIDLDRWAQLTEEQRNQIEAVLAGVGASERAGAPYAKRLTLLKHHLALLQRR